MDAPAEPYGIGEGFAPGQGSIEVHKGRSFGDAGGGFRIVRPGDIGGIEHGEGAERAATAGAVRIGDQGGDIAQGPNVQGAGQEGDKDDIGGEQRAAQAGRIAAPGVNHHIINATRPALNKGMEGGPIGAGDTFKGRGDILLDANGGGLGGATLIVSVNQKD